jgi:hypothetical protein
MPVKYWDFLVAEHKRIAVVFQLQLILFSIFGMKEWLNDSLHRFYTIVKTIFI